MTAAPGNCDTISQTVKLNENVLITFLATATVSNVNLKCYLLQRPNQRWLEQGLWNEPPPRFRSHWVPAVWPQANGTASLCLSVLI